MYMFTLNVRLNANMYITAHKKSYPNQLIWIAFGEVNSILKNDRPNPKKQKRHSIRISRKTYRRDYICPGKSHAG